MSESQSSGKINVVVIGGGSGIHPLLLGLKKLYQDYAITAVVAMSDSGGSNARIRDEFGLLPLSDINRALAALAADEVAGHEQIMRELFLYRFEKGNGLRGHTAGNMLLVALSDILGSEAAAIEAANRILRVRGRVLPVTTDVMDLQATYSSGEVVKGEGVIDEPPQHRHASRIEHICAHTDVTITPQVAEAVAAADIIVAGPGDLYTSVLANIVVGGMPEALQKSAAQLVFFANIMTKPGQTQDLSVAGHVEEFTRYAKRAPDVVIVNTSAITDEVLQAYADADQFPVRDDSETLPMQVVRADLLNDELVQQSTADTVRRSLVRGHPDKMAAVIAALRG